MDLTAIYHKTPKGQEEMASRAYKLPARERSVLILVDGKSTARDIIAKAKHFGDAEQFFEALVRGGFIEPVAGTQPAPQAPAATPAAASATVSRSLAETKDFACTYLVKALGPYADTMTGSIEACRERNELLAILEKYRDMLRDGVGKRKAEEFWNGAMARLP
ncbi:MAG: hypothetical protein ACOZCP_03790 [Pseudomonadota bacterium]